MKDTFYFSHDYNARNDSKVKKLLQKHGFLGYGIFWAIIEDLYNNENELQLDYEMLSYDLRTDIEVIKSIINDFDLFIINGQYFGSKSIEKRLNERDKKSKTAKDNARKRWGDDVSRTKANECIFYVLRFVYGSETFIKCGITSESISRRYSGKTNKYDYVVLYQQEMPTLKALDMEDLIENNCKKYTPIFKFGGFLECYDISDESKILDLAMQRECKGNAIKERKGKELNEIKEKDNIDDRKLKFSTTLKPFLEIYGKEMLIQFYNYWTEPNKSNTKFRQEMEKTWDLTRRLNTWASNDKSFKNTKKDSKFQHNSSVANNVNEYFKNKTNENAI